MKKALRLISYSSSFVGLCALLFFSGLFNRGDGYSVARGEVLLSADRALADYSQASYYFGDSGYYSESYYGGDVGGAGGAGLGDSSCGSGSGTGLGDGCSVS